MLRMRMAWGGAAALVLSCCGSAFAADEARSLLTRCWSPAALAASAKERMPVRRRVPLDMAALGRVAALPAPAVPQALRGPIRRVKLPPGEKLIALTLDLCETTGEVAGYDGGIVDYLRAHGVKATFFAGGQCLETHKERAEQLLADPLFEIGHHGWAHRDHRRLSPAKLNAELTLTLAAYQRARKRLAGRACALPTPAEAAPLSHVPPRMRLFRFPYGTCNAQALDAAAAAGLLSIQWDVVTGDPMRGRSAGAIARTVLARTRPGSIIIAHANGRGWNTAAALPLFIPKLRAQGYRFVTVSELLAAGTPEIARSCYIFTPGDQPRFGPDRRITQRVTRGRRARDTFTILQNAN